MKEVVLNLMEVNKDRLKKNAAEFSLSFIFLAIYPSKNFYRINKFRLNRDFKCAYTRSKINLVAVAAFLFLMKCVIIKEQLSPTNGRVISRDS